MWFSRFCGVERSGLARGPPPGVVEPEVGDVGVAAAAGAEVGGMSGVVREVRVLWVFICSCGWWA